MNFTSTSIDIHFALGVNRLCVCDSKKSCLAFDMKGPYELAGRPEAVRFETKVFQ